MRFYQASSSVFSDARVTIDIMVAEGDMVATYGSFTGTQDGRMGLFPPTDKEVDSKFLSVIRLENGKIAELWVEWDNLAILTQLGHLPPPGERRFTRSPGMTTLHDRWSSPISHVLYYVIFAPDPPAEAERVAATVAEERSREEIGTLIEEIRLELADPVQQVRDILNQDQPEEVLREYLHLLADQLEQLA